MDAPVVNGKDLSKQKPDEENSDFFISKFSQKHKALENELNNITANNEKELTELFKGINLKIVDLEKSYTRSISFLPNYIRKSTQEKLKSLLDLSETQKMKFLPKKKFGFLKKNNAKNVSKQKPLSDIPPEQPKKVNMEALCSQDTLSILDCSDCEVSKGAEEVEGKDIVISGAQNACIKLTGIPGFVSISKVVACQIYIGPVKGSVLIDECRDCTFEVACQQLRIHRTTSCSFYMYVTSKAIIEDSSKLGFAPFHWFYPGVERDFKKTGFDQLQNNWADVDDFDWLVQGQQSPNWFLIAEKERIEIG